MHPVVIVDRRKPQKPHWRIEWLTEISRSAAIIAVIGLCTCLLSVRYLGWVPRGYISPIGSAGSGHKEEAVRLA